MTKLYLSNTTKHRRDFYFHPAGADTRGPHVRMTIEPGAQIVIPGDYDLAWAKKMIEREQKYGWISATEFSRNRGFVGIVWSIDKPVSESLISATVEKNDDVLDEEAMQEQRRVALAASQMGEVLPTSNMPIAPPREFDMHLDEQPLIGKDTDKDLINTTVEVRQGRASQNTGRGRGRPRRAA